MQNFSKILHSKINQKCSVSQKFKQKKEYTIIILKNRENFFY